MQQPNDAHDRFVAGLDLQQPDWWITFADEQDKAHYIRETWGWDGKPAAPEHIARLRESLRGSVARRLMLGCRAAVEAGLVKPAD